MGDNEDNKILLFLKIVQIAQIHVGSPAVEEHVCGQISRMTKQF